MPNTLTRVDGLTALVLGVEDVEERPVMIQGGELFPADFPVDIFHAAFAFGELRMRAGLSCACWKEQGTLEAVRTVAVGVIELFGEMHGQADGTAWGAIRQAITGRLTVLVELNRRDAFMTNCRFLDETGISRAVHPKGVRLGSVLDCNTAVHIHSS
jgi:hypothetical protein